MTGLESRLQYIDKLTIGDHSYLRDEDICCYLGDYYPDKNYSRTTYNQTLHNFKKFESRKGLADYKYKIQAITTLTEVVRNKIVPNFRPGLVTLVPTPSSKCKADPEYDDRLMKILASGLSGGEINLKEILYIDQNMKTSHLAKNGERMKPTEIQECLRINENECQDVRDYIVIFDDILTTGAHFKACQATLQQRFPGKQIIGLFLGRTNRNFIIGDAIRNMFG
ncbi:hypothetical protein ACE38W_14880 [Chitinophaga sp. Hz27]|uniref:hypothetical protein n=1 Tax=Chitinophaga sp. Hz27 TaxID=3347169 RepID=UPI0035E20D77